VALDDEEWLTEHMDGVRGSVSNWLRILDTIKWEPLWAKSMGTKWLAGLGRQLAVETLAIEAMTHPAPKGASAPLSIPLAAFLSPKEAASAIVYFWDRGAKAQEVPALLKEARDNGEIEILLAKSAIEQQKLQID